MNVAAQISRGAVQVEATVSENADSLRRFDEHVETMAASGELVVASSRTNGPLREQEHQYLQQIHNGVPVHGAGVSRHRINGQTVSLFGTVHLGIDADTVPQLGPATALGWIERHAGTGAATAGLPELVILQSPSGRYALSYRATMRNFQTYFVDADSGSVVRREPAIHAQSVGTGWGIRGQQKKVSTLWDGQIFIAQDRLRPAEIVTLDTGEDLARLFTLASGESYTRDDVAKSASNVWNNSTVVDAHVHAGFTYDYFATRHGWNGLDGENGRMVLAVNSRPDFFEAFYAPPPFGPDQSGIAVFGVENRPLVALDIVAHELMHAVTGHLLTRRIGGDLIPTYSSIPGPTSFAIDGKVYRCGKSLTWNSPLERDWIGRHYRLACEDSRFLLYTNDAGVIHEAWADIFAAAVEFSVHDPAIGPLRADYESGEDVREPIRSSSDPGSVTFGNESVRFPFPDAYRSMIRFLVGVFEDNGERFFSPWFSFDGETVVSLGSPFYDGIHWNSTVLSHAYYLAVEGGVNRTTGRAVSGVGRDRRHDIEHVFFRAMADWMPPCPTLHMASAVLREAAINLYGRGSTVHNAIDQALHAVGLQQTQ